MININGVDCNTIEEVEAQITDLSEEQKQFVRNDFYKIPNEPKIAAHTLSARQLRIMLFQMGIPESQVLEAIAQMSDPEKTIALIEWERATYFERHEPKVAMIGAALGFTSEQLDQLWLEGSAL